MIALSMMVLGLITVPLANDTTRVVPRPGPTLQGARAGVSAIERPKPLPTQAAIQGPQEHAAVAGAFLLGAMALGVSLAAAQDRDSTGPGAGGVILFTIGGAVIGFTLGALIAGPG